MTSALIRLKQIFCENGVQSFRSFRDLTPKQRQRLDSSVYGWFSSYKDATVGDLKNNHGLSLCLGITPKLRDELFGDPLETVVKKLTLLSQTGVLLTAKFHHPGARRKPVDDLWYYLVLNYMPLIDSGLLAVLPKGVTYLVNKNQVEGDTFVLKRRSQNVERNWFLFEEEIPFLKVIDLSENGLRCGEMGRCCLVALESPGGRGMPVAPGSTGCGAICADAARPEGRSH